MQRLALILALSILSTAYGQLSHGGEYCVELIGPEGASCYGINGYQFPAKACSLLPIAYNLTDNDPCPASEIPSKIDICPGILADALTVETNCFGLDVGCDRIPGCIESIIKPCNTDDDCVSVETKASYPRTISTGSLACKCECELCHPKGDMCNDTSVYSPANDESCTVYFAPCCRTVSDHDEPNAGSVLTTFSLMLSILCMSVMLL